MMTSPSRVLTRQDVREAVARRLGVDPDDIDVDENLVVLGLGSLEMMQLVNDWERAGVRVEFRELAAGPTLRGWWDHLTGDREDPATGDRGPAAGDREGSTADDRD
ncbi:phosphopantetheine-binding protein [Saccharothrix sp. HUAS TT1]|uniref:phosphopantetheine-binding protein n=1 Tax=unclassified Saccharothrix TaxID=2593673 RepID=UPI00345C080A